GRMDAVRAPLRGIASGAELAQRPLPRRHSSRAVLTPRASSCTVTRFPALVTGDAGTSARAPTVNQVERRPSFASNSAADTDRTTSPAWSSTAVTRPDGAA